MTQRIPFSQRTQHPYQQTDGTVSNVDHHSRFRQDLVGTVNGCEGTEARHNNDQNQHPQLPREYGNKPEIVEERSRLAVEVQVSRSQWQGLDEGDVHVAGVAPRADVVALADGGQVEEGRDKVHVVQNLKAKKQWNRRIYFPLHLLEEYCVLRGILIDYKCTVCTTLPTMYVIPRTLRK